MRHAENLPPSQRWAQMRFAIIGTLLAQPPAPGALRARLTELASRTWQHPITDAPLNVSLSTIRRWYYAARQQDQPTQSLVRAVRRDAGRSRPMDDGLLASVRSSFQDHPAWTYQLHYDNLIAGLPEQRRQTAPSYATLRRWMQREGLIPRHHTADRHHTPAARATQARFAHREVRRYEHTHTHALWHIDGHHGSLPLSHQGQMQRPVLIAILDDHARFICHAQWFWHEDTASAAHALSQAFAKRGLPRMLLSDNGGPFVAPEIRHGLHRLSVLHQTTMCYAPNQNGKMEVFWAQIEGRLLAMLQGQQGLDLYRLNALTQAWVEHDYHRRLHSGIGTTPLERYQHAPHAGRAMPEAGLLDHAFTRRETRHQRRSDGSISLAGKRFEIPSRYRHLSTIVVRYASWDLDQVYLAHPDTDAILERLWPVDVHGHASGARKEFAGPVTRLEPRPATEPPLPPVLEAALRAASMTGLPPAFIAFVPDAPPSPSPSPSPDIP